MKHTDFAALLAELPKPVAACLARCRVASLGRWRAQTRRREGTSAASVARLADLEAQSREVAALARRYRSQPVDVSGVVLEVYPDHGAGSTLRRWARFGRSAVLTALSECSVVKVERYQGNGIVVGLFIGVADQRRSQITRYRFAANMDDAERTARRWAACAAAVLVVRPYLPELEEVSP